MNTVMVQKLCGFDRVELSMPARVGLRLETPTGHVEMVSVVRYEDVDYAKTVNVQVKKETKA